MADTQRTVSFLQGLLADNTSNDISEQDLRDFLVSCQVNCGQLYVSSSSATTVGSSSTWYEAAGTFTLGASAKNYSKAANNRLQYDGTPTQLSLVVAHFTLSCASSSQTLGVGVAKNGTVLTGADVRFYINATGTDTQSGCVVALTSAATGDYFGIWVRNDTGANNVTLTHGSIVAVNLLN